MRAPTHLWPVRRYSEAEITSKQSPHFATRLERKAEIQLDFIRFTLIRRSTRRTTSLSVRSSQNVVVLAPYFSTTGAAISLVKHHREWILDKLSHYQTKHIDTQKKYLPGDTVFYLGHPYTLATGSGSSIKLSNEQILVPALQPATVQKRLEAWYKLRAADIFLDRLTLYEPKVGQQHSKLRLSSANSRWGSCSTTGTISLRWTLIMAPLSVLDYVVIHELCHLVHMNHSRSFWKLVKKIYPNMKDAVHWLKSNGHTLALPKP